jgi:phosphoribosylcarboxyaminoimidazole (NCAIR) mutase
MNPVAVLVLMGSDSDAPVMQGAMDILKEFGIAAEMTVASAHRSPDRVMRLVREAPGRGVKVFIVGAGAAAHLAGVVAAHTTMPVSIGKPGATNAGVLAAQIIALADPRIAGALDGYKKKLAEKVEAAAEKLKS